MVCEMQGCTCAIPGVPACSVILLEAYIQQDGGSASQACYQHVSSPKPNTTMSDELLTAAYQQLRRIEDHWRHNKASSRRPLMIMTYWYKPTIDESGKGSTSRAIPRSRTIDAPGDVHAVTPRSGRSKKKTNSSSAKQQELKKGSDEMMRVSMIPSEGPAIRLRRVVPAREPVETAKGRPAYLHKKHERHAQPRAEGNTVAEATPIWKEVRWTESTTRASRPTANTKARRNNSGLRPNTAAVNEQPVKAQTGRTTAEDRTKSVNPIGEAAGPGIVLAHRPARPRSLSRVRPNP